MEDKQVKLVTKECPNCGGRLNVPSESNDPVDCPRCDQRVIPVSTVAQRAFEKKGESLSISQENLDRIATTSAAESFFDSFMATYEWDEFVYKYDQLSIPEVDKVLKNLKITSSNDHKVWKLSVQALLEPIRRKVEHLHLLAEVLVKVYESDETEAYRIFDAYRSTNNFLFESKDYLIEKAESFSVEYLKYAPKVGATSLDKYIEELKEILKTITPIEKMIDIPEFKKSSDAKNKEIARRLKNEGLDVEEIYFSAKEFYENGKYNEALTKFVQIRGYKDSDAMITKCNHFFYSDYYLEIGKNAYFISSRRLYQLKDLPKIKDHKGSEIKTPNNESLVKDIYVLIGRFGTRLFYFDMSFTIHVYDFATGDNRIIDAGKKYYLGEKKNRYWFSNDGLKVYFLEYLQNTFITHPSVKERERNKNNFALVSINLASNAEVKQTVIPELVDVYYMSENVIFYEYDDLTIEMDQRGKKPQGHFVHTEKYVAKHLQTGEMNSPLKKEEIIGRVYKDKVIFVRYNKTVYNMSLCIKSIFDQEAEETIIDPNVYDYEFITKGAIYYTVGNGRIKSLYRYDLEKSHIEEVITRFRTEDYHVIGDYLYYYTGDEYNRTLKKFGLVTGRTIVLASGINEVFKIADGYFYYSDNSNRLCSVRIDGTDYNMLAENVTDFIGVHNNRVYYVREEYAGKELRTKTKKDENQNDIVVEEEVDKVGVSLYSCTAQGYEVRKVAFDTFFVASKTDDLEDLLIVYKENRSFKCITKGQNPNPFTREIFTYTNLNLSNGIQEVKFTTNFPSGLAMMEDKRGCFFFKRKYKEVKLEYEEIENHEKYKRKDLVPPGFVSGQENN
jgi:hypothetical protein